MIGELSHREMEQEKCPFDCLRRAQRAFASADFDTARKLVEHYQQTVSYASLPVVDNRHIQPGRASIVVVTFGGGADLLRCIDSVLGKAGNDAEVIVVDNGGNEKVAPQLTARPVLVVKPPFNVLPSEGRNIGAYFARGEVLAFLDDDAVVGESFVEALLEAWELYDFAAIRGKILPLSSGGNNTFVGHYDLGAFPIPAVLITEGNMAMPADVFREVGGFDPLLFGGEGTELTSRCFARYPGRDIYYWPRLLIYHDYACGDNLDDKKRRHALANRYFSQLDAEMKGLQSAYGRWYAKRPGKHFRYDNRSFSVKLRVFASERLMAFKRMLPLDKRR